MAHAGKRPGTITRLRGPSTLPCPAPVVSEEWEEDPQHFRGDGSEQPICSNKDKDNNNAQLSNPVLANHYFVNCDPSPEDMDEEDTCSEYDNMGSDVEQDCIKVFQKGPDGVDKVYYNHYCPEEGIYVEGAANFIDKAFSTADQYSLRSLQGKDELQTEAKPQSPTPPFDQCHAPMAGDKEKLGEQNEKYFPGEEEEMLDGATFIEDFDEPEVRVQRQAPVTRTPEGERIKVGGGDKEAGENGEGVSSKRNCLVHEGGKKPGCEAPDRGSKEKERQSRGRGKRATGEDNNHIASEAKGVISSAEPHTKTLSENGKKAAILRPKPRASGVKAHPPPPPHLIQAQNPTRSQHRRGGPSLPRPSIRPTSESPDGPVSQARAVGKPSPPLHPSPEQLKESIDDRHADQPKQLPPMPQDVPEQPRRPPCADAKAPRPAEANHHTPQKTQETASFPSFVDVPGPCEPEDLIDGIIFAANYLGCTQVLSDKNPSKAIRMSQAQEAVSHIKSQDDDSQMVTEVDLFISTKAVKVLNADTQETMMDSALRTISYIADIGSIVVLMARRHLSQTTSQDCTEAPLSTSEGKKQYRMICYVFESEDAQLIAQSIGQAFSVAYREFLRANGINPKDLSQKQYSDIINSQEMYNDDLIHFSNSDNCKELHLEKQKGESLGVVIVESGWGSILPTVILANMLNSGPAARSGKLSIGDQIMSINDTSLVGLPLATCQGIIKGLKTQVQVKLSIVSCPPVTTVLIKRPDLKFQLGFSVQNGIICSLMRGGIAERGGVRVGHRIIEINGQSVVAMAHEKIVQTLSVSVGEINMKTMPAVMFRLLTGQETPFYI
ncbi:uncharacterized protein apba2a [Aplochiton taeniatus]